MAHFRHISSRPRWMQWPRQSLTLAVVSSCIAFWALALKAAQLDEEDVILRVGALVTVSAERRGDAEGQQLLASAARWATLPTFDVEWDCRLVAATITSSGPTIHPTRQPVMA